MRKLLACLLALMLPCCALADAITVDLSWSLFPEGMCELFYGLRSLETAPGERYPLLEEWFWALASFTNDFKVTFTGDSANGRGDFALAYQEDSLFSCEAAVTDKGLILRHSLLADMPLLLPGGGPDADKLEALAEAFGSTDWDAVFSVFSRCATRWADVMDQSETTGRYAGDAYAGGTRRTTLRFDERDLALLLDLLLDADWPEGFPALLRGLLLAVGAEPDEALELLRDGILQTALANRYRYVLHLVSDDEEPIGLSLIVYQEEQQVATLSVGYPRDGDGMTAVLGYGLRSGNVYLAMQVSEPDEEGRFLAARLLRATDRSFHGAADDAQGAVWALDLYDLSDDRMDIIDAVMHGDVLVPFEISTAFSAMREEQGAAYCVLVKLNQTSLFSTTLRHAAAADLPPLDLEGLEPLDVSNLSADEALRLAEGIQKALTGLSVRIFKLMPAKLFTLPLNWDILTPE